MAESFALMAQSLDTREDKIAMRIEMFRRLTGSAEPFNEARQRDIATTTRAVGYDAKATGSAGR